MTSALGGRLFCLLESNRENRYGCVEEKTVVMDHVMVYLRDIKSGSIIVSSFNEKSV